MGRIGIIYFLLALTLTGLSQSFTVESIPNTKRVNNSYVSDPSHILHDTTVTRINQLLSDLEQNATAQVAVVMLPSIGSEEYFDFAQRLFNYWGIGQACGTIESLRYPNNSTKFTKCPKCKYLTFHADSRRTVQSATYTAAGYGEEERRCRHCGHHHIERYTIPMLVASSSDSNSSSSSRGSWGGGSSGGGGASNSW